MHKYLYGLAAVFLSVTLVACAGNTAPPPVNTAPATTAPAVVPSTAPASYPSPEAEKIPYPPPTVPAVAPTTYPGPELTPAS